MVTKKSWADFRQTGLLLFVNSLLHVFGWSLIIEIDANGNETCYPARVKWRGFDIKETHEAHRKLASYLKENSVQLEQEAHDE